MSAINPPPWQPNAFTTTDGGIIILESLNDNCTAAAADEHSCSLEEAPTPDAVRAEAADEETATVDLYLSVRSSDQEAEGVKRRKKKTEARRNSISNSSSSLHSSSWPFIARAQPYILTVLAHARVAACYKTHSGPPNLMLAFRALILLHGDAGLLTSPGS
jgi:hypothetical protein